MVVAIRMIGFTPALTAQTKTKVKSKNLKKEKEKEKEKAVSVQRWRAGKTSSINFASS